MTKLYELSDQMRGLQRLIDEGEVDAEVLQDTLEGLQGDLQAKGSSVLEFMANLATDVAAFSIEIKRLQARKKTIETQFDWMRNYLRDNMDASGITKIESPTFSATLRKATKMVELVDEEMIPAPWRTTETVQKVTIDKAMIKRDLTAGIDVPGAKLVEAKRGLLIR
jgi:hypothetical protein